jgi:hypothetical protein
MDILQVNIVFGHGFARAVGDFDHGAVVAADHFQHDGQRREVKVVGQVCSDAKLSSYSALELLSKRDDLRDVQAVGEDRRFRAGIDAELFIVRDQLFAPYERIAGIVRAPS